MSSLNLAIVLIGGGGFPFGVAAAAAAGGGLIGGAGVAGAHPGPFVFARAAAPAGGGLFGGAGAAGAHPDPNNGGVWRHGDVIATLPEGARPTKKMIFACLANGCLW